MTTQLGPSFCVLGYGQTVFLGVLGCFKGCSGRKCDLRGLGGLNFA